MNIGLVLSGAMAKGAFEVGALKALGNFIPKEEIKYISSASIGTANAYAYACDKLDVIEEMWRGICCGNNKATIPEIVKGTLIQEYIEKLLGPEDKIENPFYCTLFDAKHRNVSYKDLSGLNTDELKACLRASVAFPFYNAAIKIDGGDFYDGGLVDNIPIYPLKDHDCDYIICIYFDDVSYKFESTELDKKIIKVFFPTMGRFRQSVVIHDAEIDSMIKDGYERTEFVLSRILSGGYEDVEGIYRAIERFNAQLPPAQTRMTTDVLITNINKATQRLTRRKLI